MDRMTAGRAIAGCRRSIRFPGLSPGRYYQVTNRLTSELLAKMGAGPYPGVSHTYLNEKLVSCTWPVKLYSAGR